MTFIGQRPALGVELATARSNTNDALAGSAVAAPAAGFGTYEKYPDFASKASVLLQAVASNHALPDGNKRTALLSSPRLVIYPAEYIGDLPYTDHTIHIGELAVRDVHGYNPAGVYVRRVSGKTDGISVAEIIVTVVGDGYAQEELDLKNAEAERYPLGPKEFWRGRLVGKATYGRDAHPMTDAEFEADWAESEES